MIRLTGYHNGSPIYVPADVVIKENYKYEYGSKNALPVTEYKPIDGAMVVYDGIEYAVKESPEEVARKVLEWRLAMERYRARYQAIANVVEGRRKELEVDPFIRCVDTKKYLENLAGLEETNESH